MLSLVPRATVILLALALMASGVGAQSKKKRKARTAKAATSKTTKPPQQPYTGDPTPPPQLPEHHDGVQRINVTDANEAVKKGTAVIVDVRALESYKMGHIKGALSIPINEFGARLKEFPRGKMIITYCSWPAEHSSAGAALILKKNGFNEKNLAALLGGYQAWISAGFPTESNQ